MKFGGVVEHDRTRNQYVYSNDDWKTSDKFYSLDYHTIICDKCMEIALNRKLRKTDLKGCPANQEYMGIKK